MSKFRTWYVRQQNTISGFLAGINLMGMVDNLINERFGYALLSFVIVVVLLYSTKEQFAIKE